MADLSALLAELGGDNPQNRAIAEGLQKQGINSTKDIGVRKVTVPGDVSGSDESRYQAPDRIENAYFNKKDNKEIDPNRLGIYDVKDGDKVQGNIFFHLDADDKGNVSFRPQWSPRAHGFLRDNAVGRLIMAAGKIIPATSPFFVAADVVDKLAHGKVMDAVVTAIPYGIQEFAKSAELLKGIAGNSDFVATAKTAAGKIAEAAGAPSYAADLAGKVATSGITAGLTGENVGKAMLKAGANSLLGESKNFLQAAGDFSKMGIGGLLPEGISAEDFEPEALEELGGALEEVDVSPEDISPNWEGKGWGEIGEGEFADEIRPTFDLTGRDDIEPILDGRDNIEEGIGSLNVGTTGILENKDGIGSLTPDYSLEGGAGSDYVSPEGEGMVDDAGEFGDVNVLDKVTVDPNAELTLPPGAEPDEVDLEEDYLLNPDDIDPTAPLTLPPGADPDEVDLEEDYLLNPDDPYSKLTLPPGAEPDELPEEEPYLLNPDDPYSKLTLPPGAEPDEEKPEEPYLLNPDETIVGGKGNDTITGGKSNDTIVSGGGNDSIGGGGLTDIIGTIGKVLPLVPAIFPPRRDGPETRTVTPTVTGGTGNDTLTGGTGNDGLTSITDSLLGKDPLTGGYSFSWNKQKTQAPEKGIAYGQRYYGNQWSKSDKTEPPKTEAPKTETPKTEPPKTEPRKEFTTMPVEDPNMTIGHYGRYTPTTESPTSQIQFAEGGLMALGSHTFKPTMTDAGISSEHLAKNDVAGQAIQHMRKGGHVVDHKTHKDVHYLASKGEPVHHIVGFMNHRKRMAEGGITSHSLGSYSDGGHLLKGPGDGMSDDIPATIADKQPARLANEEFVIPADVVSHLGNGSSESGAKVLYEMMARIRKARTGNPKQGKQINPHKLLPKV
jgi:Ca2+-binding RTX toxin-like protein